MQWPPVALPYASVNHDGSRLVAAAGGHAWWWDLTEAHPSRVPLELGVKYARVLCLHCGRFAATDFAPRWHPTDVGPRHVRAPRRADPHRATSTSKGQVQNQPAVSRDRRWIAIKGSNDLESGVVRVWDVDTGRLVAELDDLDELVAKWDLPARRVTSLSFSPDGTSLAASNSPERRSCGTHGPGNATAIRSPRQGIFTLAFSPDGRYLVTGNQFDNRLTIRDAHTYQPVGAVSRGTPVNRSPCSSRPTAGAFSAWVLTACGCGTSTARAELAALLFDSPSVTSNGIGAAYFNLSQMTPDGKRLTRIEGDHIQIWNLQPETWPDIACRAAAPKQRQSKFFCGSNLSRAQPQIFNTR